MRKLARVYDDTSKALLSDDALKRASSQKVQELMQKRASYSVLQSYETRFSPFRMRPYVETRTLKREVLDSWYRYYYEHDPYVGTAIDLHSEFPLSSFELDHEDEGLRREYNEIAEQLDLSTLLMRMAVEYWAIGECFVFGFFDDPNDPSCWESFILLDPTRVTLEASPFVKGGKWYTISLQADPKLKELIDKGPRDKDTGELYNKIPVDILEYVKAGKPIKLNPIQASHFKRVTNYFQLRGSSLIQRVLPMLMYRDKLRDAQFAIADRHITPKEFYMIGESGAPANEDEIEAFRNLLAATWSDPNLAIVWHHALRVQIEGPGTKMLAIGPELDAIEREMLAGLMMSKAFIHGEGPTYANASVALDVLVSRYLVFRQRLEQWMLRHVFEPLCRIHKIYKSSAAEEAHRIKIKKRQSVPDLPTVKWSKVNLRDDQMKIMLYERLVQQQLIPNGELLKLVNLDPDEMRKKVAEEKAKSEAAIVTPTGEGLPGILPGSASPISTEPLPTGMGAGEGGTVPETVPAESTLPTGAPGAEIA